MELMNLEKKISTSKIGDLCQLSLMLKMIFIKHNKLTSKIIDNFFLSTEYWCRNRFKNTRVSQYLNFQNNVNIIHHSKETSAPDPQSEKKSHFSIRKLWECYSSFSKVATHITWENLKLPEELVNINCINVALKIYL